jgi:hypothetical protein
MPFTSNEVSGIFMVESIHRQKQSLIWHGNPCGWFGFLEIGEPDVPDLSLSQNCLKPLPLLTFRAY